MGSLTAVISHFNTIIGIPQQTPATLFHTKGEIKKFLDQCSYHEDIQHWHMQNMASINPITDCETLNILCRNVAARLVCASKTAAQFRSWAWGLEQLPDGVTSRQFLNRALWKVKLAFEEFRVVAVDDALNTSDCMAMILTYLRLVYKYGLILGSIAVPRDIHDDWLWYWRECFETGLKDFVFDDLQMVSVTDVSNRTLQNVLPLPEQVPQTFLPTYPSDPVLFHWDGVYGAPVVSNAMYYESIMPELTNVQGVTQTYPDTFPESYPEVLQEVYEEIYSDNYPQTQTHVTQESVWNEIGWNDITGL